MSKLSFLGSVTGSSQSDEWMGSSMKNKLFSDFLRYFGQN